MDIISFSLYGSNPLYWYGAVENIKLAQDIYPNFICRFYIENNSSKHLTDMIFGENVQIVYMNNRGGCDGMLWRFLAATDPNINIFLCRDTDSRLSLREKLAVNEWLQSEKNFHIMRDHPEHKAYMLGGMWGCRNQVLCNLELETKILNWPIYKYRGDDQKFLRSNVYHPYAKYSAFEHSEYGIYYDNEIHQFPSKRLNNNDFVGNIIQL
jgi:hypothetical protein